MRLLKINKRGRTIFSLEERQGYISEVSELLYKTFGEKESERLWFDDLLNYNKRSFFILIINKKLIGVIGVKRIYTDLIETKSPWITKLTIKEEYRKNGYGSLLIRFACILSKENGYKKLYLTSEEFNEQFYKNLGWISTDTVLHMRDGTRERVFYTDL